MTAKEYLDKQEPARKKLMSAIHKIILDTNKNVVPSVDKMMGVEMIQYKYEGDIFLYALASNKDYMSLHLMPMYGYKPIHDKYSKLLNKAKFQKGCLNFADAEAMPLNIVKDLLHACASIDMSPFFEHYRKQMKKKKKK